MAIEHRGGVGGLAGGSIKRGWAVTHAGNQHHLEPRVYQPLVNTLGSTRRGCGGWLQGRPAAALPNKNQLFGGHTSQAVNFQVEPADLSWAYANPKMGLRIRPIASRLVATYYTPEVTHVKFHWRIYLKSHWLIPVKFHWESDNPLDSTIEQ